MAAVLQTGRCPHLITFPSSALRVCQAAIDDRLDLHGAWFTLGGEPVTRARLQVINEAGARVVQRYAAVEASHIGYGCLAPDAPDDQHLLHDFNALIQPGQDGQCIGLEPSTLLISSLRPTAPFILLNVSLGDQAEVTQRRCGCPLEKLGWTTHLEKIRSDQKLTAGGMTFLDVDVVRVIEEVLPARFGGRPTDYQLLEEEIDGGQPRIRLLVHPALGPLDFDAIEDTFLTAIGGGSGAARAMMLQWRQARLVTVERRPPLSGASGKILHLHRRPPGAAGRS
jgi:hypothetical protein